MRLARIGVLFLLGGSLLASPSCKQRGAIGSSSGLREFGIPGGQEQHWQPCGSEGRLSTEQLQRRIEILGQLSEADFARERLGQQVDFSKEQAEEMIRAQGLGGEIYDVNPDAAAEALWLDNGNELTTSGGVFNLYSEVGDTKRLVRDNSFRYVWGWGNRKGKHLDAYPVQNGGQVIMDHPSFVNLVPQRSQWWQDEMHKYVQDGDIIVYWHPEDRDSSPSTHEQWRATHAAVIQEIPTGDPQKPCKFQTIDVPSGYARPFDSSSTTPFHVFRMTYNDPEANTAEELAELERVNFWMRSQVSRWGSMAFDKHPFNSYQKFDFRDPKLADTFYLPRYMGQDDMGSLQMYCAWFVFTNANLAWLRPMNPEQWSGMQGDLGQKWQALYSGQFTVAYEGNLQMSHRVGPTDMNEADRFKNFYALPEGMQGHPALNFKDSFAFDPMTPPEMLLGFMDKVIGSDFDIIRFVEKIQSQNASGQVDQQQLTALVAAYVGHVMTKIGFATQMRGQMLDLFRTSTAQRNMFVSNDPRIPGDDVILEEFTAEYNENIPNYFDYILSRYQKALDITVGGGERVVIQGPQQVQEILQKVAGNREAIDSMVKSMGGKLRFIRKTIYGLIVKDRFGERDFQGDRFARTKAAIKEAMGDDVTEEELQQVLATTSDGRGNLHLYGKKWVPPYMYLRVAENHESMYMKKEVAEKYQPNLVYVATVLPEKYITGELPVADVELEEGDQQALSQAAQVLRVNADVQAVNSALFTKLQQQGDNGFNTAEANALKTMQTHWDQEIVDQAAAGRRVDGERVKLHNSFGIGPNLMFRILANYWNAPLEPNIFRPAIYGPDGSRSNMVSATGNLRLLQQDPLGEFKSRQTIPANWDDPNVHPRRTNPVPCKAGSRAAADGGRCSL